MEVTKVIMAAMETTWLSCKWHYSSGGFSYFVEVYVCL